MESGEDNIIFKSDLPDSMKNIDILSFNLLGKTERLVADHQSVKTSFRKLPAEQDELTLEMTGFKGDKVTHTDVHGGNDKAICCYPAIHFAYWKETLDFDLEPGAFGENLTLSGEAAREEQVCIGNRYQLGEAVVEVSEPRGPCFIIGIRYNYKPFPVHLQETGFTGFYLRTIVPGKVSRGDSLIHLSTHPEAISVMDANRVRYHQPNNKALLERLATLDVLTEDWRERFARMLRKLNDRG